MEWKAATRLTILVLASALWAFKPVQSQGQEQAETSRHAAAGPFDGALEQDAHGIRTTGARPIRPGPDYRIGVVGRRVLGADYRGLWAARVEVPVLDMARTAGGLTVTGAAGGVQSSLLFLEGGDGRHFVLRKLEKRAGDALPAGARRTIVEDVVQDQVSSLNPYAALVVAPLAEAAGVLYTAPSLVLVPNDSLLGEHREVFAGEPALLERKVDEDVSSVERFGYPEEVVDFDELVRRLRADPDVRVDQHAFLRARLFDMWIGDRDRHDAQYFWALSESGTRFVPLPIDRDFAFARFDGLLNRLGRFSGQIELRKQTYFAEEIHDLVGLNFQGAKLDFRFTSELTRQDWTDIARELQAALSDAVIEEAIRAWPAPIFEAVGTQTIELLKARREDLQRAAADYYKTMTQKVDVVGTETPDRFDVLRSDDHVVVTVRDTTSRTWYRRRFAAAETDEIRIFGQEGDDVFTVAGSPADGIMILAVGGRGEDTVSAESDRPLGRFTFFDTELSDASYDRLDFEEVDDSSGLEYAFHRYELDRAGPLAAFDYDSGEGIYLGAGAVLTRYGFRREPYAARHRISANYAPASRGFNLHYDGEVNEIAGEWDARWEADILDEERFNDFYGFGNETEGSDAVRDRFVAHFRWVRAFPGFYRNLGPFVQVGAGPYFEYADIEAPPGFTEESPPSGLRPEQMRDRYVAGVRSRFEVDTRDTTFLPRSGVRWLAEAGFYVGARRAGMQFTRLSSEVSTFVSSPLPGRPTLALRAGGATNVGEFAFYQANTLGGRENLRGYRKTRFSGRSRLFGNAELRLKLADFNVYLTRGGLGVLGFYDVGRVWADDERSDLWHHGFGGGMWATPFDRIVVHGRVGFSEEGRVTRISAGMFY